MKTEQSKNAIIKIEAEVQQNVKTTRRALKTLQPNAMNKENLVDKPLKEAIIPLNTTDPKKPKITHMHKETQVDLYETEIQDMTTNEEPSAEYWIRLAEKRQETLDWSLQELEKLNGEIERLQEENKVDKEMLEEPRLLIEVLQEMLNEEDNSDQDEAFERKNPEQNDDDTN